MMRRFGNQMELLELDGWLEDFVIPVGNTLLLFASDYSMIWAIDRQTAEFLWMTENRPFDFKFDYLIGVQNGMIYLGGPNTVAAVSIDAEGRLEWLHSFDDGTSLGRGMLTQDAVYVPVENRIVKYDLTSGDEIARANVDLGSGAPVGNLYSDGQRIWVVGANRLYALGSAPEPPAEEESESEGEDKAEGEDSDDKKSESKSKGNGAKDDKAKDGKKSGNENE